MQDYNKTVLRCSSKTTGRKIDTRHHFSFNHIFLHTRTVVRITEITCWNFPFHTHRTCIMYRDIGKILARTSQAASGKGECGQDFFGKRNTHVLRSSVRRAHIQCTMHTKSFVSTTSCSKFYTPIFVFFRNPQA